MRFLILQKEGYSYVCEVNDIEESRAKIFCIDKERIAVYNMKESYMPFITYASTRAARWEKEKSSMDVSHARGMVISTCQITVSHHRHLKKK